MALISSGSLASLHPYVLFPKLHVIPLTDHRQVSRTVVSCSQQITRRSANYNPSIWKYDFIQSLTTDYLEETYAERANKLKKDVKQIMENEENELLKLKMINDLHKLGVSYHFEDQIKSILKCVNNNYDKDMWGKEDLYATSLKFRLLREHGFNVPQDVFNSFKNKSGNFEIGLGKDIEGLLSLYEASFLSFEDELTLDKAMNFSAKYLKESLEKNIIVDPHIAAQVTHALDLPLHWVAPRLEAIWYINVYEGSVDMNPIILELAKLDFNMVQAIHREDLKHMSRWWKNIGLGEKLKFTKDRLVESFIWTTVVKSEPRYGNLRRTLTKINLLITTVDDVYDIYATLEELELFTIAVERWDTTSLEQLPEYMKICYLALFNTINEISYDTLKEDGFLVIPYFKKVWEDLCKSFLVEAKWYYSGYKPMTLGEYMDNAAVSSSTFVILLHIYVFLSKPITNENMKILMTYPDVFRWPSMIFRFANDLAITSSEDEIEKLDIPKSVRCYMNETGFSEEKASEHVKCLMAQVWKKMNETREMDTPLITRSFIDSAKNLVRMSMCMYRYGDGQSSQSIETQTLISLLLLDPIPLD